MVPSSIWTVRRHAVSRPAPPAAVHLHVRMHSVRRPRDHVPQRAFAVALAPCSAAARLPGTRDHEGLKLQAWDKKKGFHTVIYHSPIIFSTTKSEPFACLSNRSVVKITVSRPRTYFTTATRGPTELRTDKTPSALDQGTKILSCYKSRMDLRSLGRHPRIKSRPEIPANGSFTDNPQKEPKRLASMLLVQGTH